MEATTEPSSSASAAEASSGAAAKELLRAIATVAPHLWFPRRHAEQTGAPRESLDEPLWHLRQEGLIHVGDWIVGMGQGFLLTREGEKVLEQPDPPSLSDTATCMPVPGAEPILPARPAIVAPAFLLANAVWFAVGLFLAWKAGAGVEYLKGTGDPAVNQTLLRIGAVGGPNLLHWQWWRLLTACFVHVGAFHLLANMLMFGIVGPVAEERWGRRRFAIIYLASGIVGNAVAMAIHPQTETGQDVPLAGSSGAIWGVFLCLGVWLFRYRDELPTAVVTEWSRKMGFTFVISLLMSLAPGVSLAAHLSGGAFGVVVACWLDRRWRPHWALSALGTIVLIGAALLTLLGSLYYSEDWNAVRARHGFRQPYADLLKPADER